MIYYCRHYHHHHLHACIFPMSCVTCHTTLANALPNVFTSFSPHHVHQKMKVSVFLHPWLYTVLTRQFFLFRFPGWGEKAIVCNCSQWGILLTTVTQDWACDSGKRKWYCIFTFLWLEFIMYWNVGNVFVL